MNPVRVSAGPCVELIEAGSAVDEAEILVGRIRQLLESGFRPADIVVLYRSVRTSVGPLQAALRRENIPMALVGKLSLLDRPELALLARIFVFWSGGTWQPEMDQEFVSRESLTREVDSVTGAGLNASRHAVAQLERLGQHLAASSINDLIGTYLEILEILGLPVDGEGRERQEKGLGQFSRLLGEFEHAQRRHVPPSLLKARAESCSEETAEDAAILGDKCGLDNSLAVNLGLTQGKAFLARLRVFLEQFASQAAEETIETPMLDGGAVNIMTVHQAKGLEFPIVFVPALVDRRFPSSRMGEPRKWYLSEDLFDKARYEGKEDDERRLFYVSMTRARDLLVLSWFSQYERRAATRSRFIADLVRCNNNSCFVTAGNSFPEAMLRGNGDKSILDTDFGQVLIYSECPRKYYLRHICGFVPPIAPELGFGRALHHIVAELARGSSATGPPETERLDEILGSSFYLPFAGPIAYDQLYAAARRRLINYTQNHGEELVRTLFTEHRIEVPMEGARIRGRIDLVLKARGGGRDDVELIDFKTSANRPPSEQHKNQLRMYAEAVRMLGLNPVRLAIHDLDADNGGRIEVEDRKEALSEFRQEMKRMLDGMASGKFARKKSKTGWKACDYASICA